MIDLRMSRTKLARSLSTSFERVMLILSQTALIGLVIVALAFDFLNGLHDTANSIATLVSTRMLRPRYAVIWAAFFNFIAFLVFGVHVAQTIGVGIISPEVMDAQVIFGALVGAIIWNVITWWAGIPSSSSHALIGGLVGAGVTKAGVGAIVWSGLVNDRRLHRALATSWFFPCLAFGTGGFVGLCAGQSARRGASISMASVCAQRLSFLWATGAMMRKRQWASLQCYCFRKD